MFYLSPTFDLVRIAVISTVSPIVYRTILKAITRGASVPNPTADVRGNKLFTHTDRFIFSHCRLSKKPILQGSGMSCCLTCLYVRTVMIMNRLQLQEKLKGNWLMEVNKRPYGHARNIHSYFSLRIE